MATGASPAGARSSVAPMMTNRKIAVITTSHTSTEKKLYLCGDSAP